MAFSFSRNPALAVTWSSRSFLESLDFLAAALFLFLRSKYLLSLAETVADAALAGSLSLEDLQSQFEDDRVALVAKIGENINIRRVQYVSGGSVASYLHNGGKIGVVVTGEGED